MAAMMLLRPYVSSKVWKLPVKLLLLSISLLSALLNIVTFVSETKPSQRNGAEALAYVVTLQFFAQQGMHSVIL